MIALPAAYDWTAAADAVAAWNQSGSDQIADLAPQAVAFIDDALTCYIEARWPRFHAKDDLRQQAWLRLFRSLRFCVEHTRRGFRPWLNTQFRWAVGDAYRAIREAEAEAFAFPPEPTTRTDERASRVAFRELIEGLPMREQVALELRFFLGWELHEIGEAFEITAAGAGNIIYAALAQLRSGQRLQSSWRTPRSSRPAGARKTTRRRGVRTLTTAA